MIYNHNVSLIVPIAHLQTAKAVSRALDPDIGGANAFQMMLSSDGSEPVTHAAYYTPCSESFLGFLQLPPDQIHGMVAQDYAARWSDLEPPTLDEITRFLTELIVGIDQHIFDVIADNKLTLCQTSI